MYYSFASQDYLLDFFKFTFLNQEESSISYTELTFVQRFYSLQSFFLCPHDASESLAATLQRREAWSRGNLPKIASSNQDVDRALDRGMCAQDTSALALVNKRLAFTSWLSDREEGTLYLCSFFFFFPHTQETASIIESNWILFDTEHIGTAGIAN